MKTRTIPDPRPECPTCLKEMHLIEVSRTKEDELKIVFICTSSDCKETGSFDEDGIRIS